MTDGITIGQAASFAGVTVKTTFWVAVDTMLMVAGDSESVMAGNLTIWTALCALASSPSPLAVTVTTAELRAAVEAAFSVNVDTVVVTPLTEKLLPLHEAVTPAGSPVAARVTVPAKTPPVVVVIESVAVSPCITETLADPALTVSVGGG